MDGMNDIEIVTASGKIFKWKDIKIKMGSTPNGIPIDPTQGFITRYIISDLTPPFLDTDRLIGLKLLFASCGVKISDGMEILNLTKSGDKHFMLFRVHYHKRKSKIKKIYSPLPNTKKILSKIANKLSDHVTWPPHVFGVRWRGIDDAMMFLGKPKKIREIDIKSAYPSTTRSMVENALKRFFRGKSTMSLKNLAVMLTPNFYLPIGYPTSPLVFNLVMEPIDNLISSLMSQHSGLKIVRYVDNIYIYDPTGQDAIQIARQIINALHGLGYKTRDFSSSTMLSVCINSGSVKGTIWHKTKSLLDDKKIPESRGMISFLSQLYGQLKPFVDLKEENIDALKEKIDSIKNTPIDVWA